MRCVGVYALFRDPGSADIGSGIGEERARRHRAAMRGGCAAVLKRTMERPSKERCDSGRSWGVPPVAAGAAPGADGDSRARPAAGRSAPSGP